ncbi:MAG TPA: type II toxin-antitoxin system RelE/ParE family toxin [Ferruginibacter sp.]|nr:type II toxin-antitoxin system RelE/ParE family toxin [Ferruginibacter sp.]HMP21918.1 type II toxin-antitoxin system RelE/ParE family toxin [Ferruginibacter sp.]
MVKNQLVWTKRSLQHMRALYKYIGENSPQNALKVVNDIIAAMEKITANPEYYNPDKYKIDNDGSYRAFEKHRYRIVYRYQKNIIRVLRIRHTKMEPRNY